VDHEFFRILVLGQGADDSRNDRDDRYRRVHRFSGHRGPQASGEPMRKLLFESICFIASMAYAPLMAWRYSRLDVQHFAFTNELAAVSVGFASIFLTAAVVNQLRRIDAPAE
jgi:hypothetical protein